MPLDPVEPTRKINLLIDIQNSIKAQNSPGYEHWAKIFNLKQAAQTLLFLQEQEITQLEKLEEKSQAAKDDFNQINTAIQNINHRQQEISTLQKHIGAYRKTKDIYVAYRKAGYSKKYLEAHQQEIEKHKAAKAFFNEKKLEKIPTIKQLQQEYATLSAEKKKEYASYHPARKFMQDVLTAKQNAHRLLQYRDGENTKKMTHR